MNKSLFSFCLILSLASLSFADGPVRYFPSEPDPKEELTEYSDTQYGPARSTAERIQGNCTPETEQLINQYIIELQRLDPQQQKEWSERKSAEMGKVIEKYYADKNSREVNFKSANEFTTDPSLTLSYATDLSTLTILALGAVKHDRLKQNSTCTNKLREIFSRCETIKASEEEFSYAKCDLETYVKTVEHSNKQTTEAAKTFGVSDLCVQFGDLAGTVMSSRQKGISKESTLQFLRTIIPDSSAINQLDELLITPAYEIPLYSTDEEREAAVLRFATQKLQFCK